MSTQTFRTINHDGYEIEERPGHLSPAYSSPFLHRLTILATWTIWGFYVASEFSMISSLAITFPHFSSQLWLLVVCEVMLEGQQILLALNALIPLCSNVELRVRSRYTLVGWHAPNMVAAVTCCGENTDAVMRTLRAVLNQDYPSSNLHVYLLDDGNSAALKKLAAIKEDKLRKSGSEIRFIYLARSSSRHFKAGNLQHGIQIAKHDANPIFFASLDADMVPHKMWLRRMVPHLILDQDLALACPPQSYENVPPGDPLAQQTDLDMWFKQLEHLNDQLGGAMCTGSGFVVRMDALDDIGGWPLTDAGEDFMCSTALNAAGWKTAYIPEHDLQTGLCPDSLVGHILQRQRWVDSGMAVHRRFNYWATKRSIGKTTPGQRVVRVLQLLRELCPILTLFSCIGLSYALSSVSTQVLRQFPTTSVRSLYLFGIQALIRWVHDSVMYNHIGRIEFAHFLALDIWCSPYMSLRLLSYFVPDSLAACMRFKFEASGAVSSPLNERSVLGRAKLLDRVFNRTFMFQAALAAYFAWALAVVYIQSVEYWPMSIMSPVTPLALACPGAITKLLYLLKCSLVPLLYLIRPPDLKP